MSPGLWVRPTNMILKIKGESRMTKAIRDVTWGGYRQPHFDHTSTDDFFYAFLSYCYQHARNPTGKERFQLAFLSNLDPARREFQSGKRDWTPSEERCASDPKHSDPT